MATTKGFKGFVALTQEQFEELRTSGSIVVDGATYTYSPTDTVYVTPQGEVVDVESEQKIEGRKVFNAETEFNEAITSNADISITNNVLKVLDDTDGKDMVTQYSADEIVVEDNGAEYTLTLPKKSGTIALTTDVPDVDVDNTTITKNDDGQLQAVALKDTASGMTLTAEQVWLACSIEREV